LVCLAEPRVIGRVDGVAGAVEKVSRERAIYQSSSPSSSHKPLPSS